MEAPIHIEQRGYAAFITLNRPAKRNALSIEMMAELSAAITRISADNSTRAIILRGAGDGFCAGLDLQLAHQTDDASAAANAVASMLKSVLTCNVPTIAAIHGFAMAGGAGLMAACDLAVAEEGTKIGFPEVRRGVAPALVSTILRRQIGERQLRELLLLAEPISAQEALRIGLINRIIGGAEAVLNEAVRLTELISRGAPGALTATKQLLLDLHETSLQTSMDQALQVHEQARRSEEAAEGIAAFLEKRDPKWVK